MLGELVVEDGGGVKMLAELPSLVFPSPLEVDIVLLRQ